MSFFVSEAPCESTRLVLPRGAPPSTSDALLSPIHFIQASIPFCLCSGVEFCIICSNSAALAMYRTRNFFIGSFSTRRTRGKSEAEGHTCSWHRRPLEMRNVSAPVFLLAFPCSDNSWARPKGG